MHINCTVGSIIDSLNLFWIVQLVACSIYINEEEQNKKASAWSLLQLYAIPVIVSVWSKS
jgi:hypothetical protein